MEDRLKEYHSIFLKFSINCKRRNIETFISLVHSTLECDNLIFYQDIVGTPPLGSGPKIDR